MTKKTTSSEGMTAVEDKSQRVEAMMTEKHISLETASHLGNESHLDKTVRTYKTVLTKKAQHTYCDAR